MLNCKHCRREQKEEERPFHTFLKATLFQLNGEQKVKELFFCSAVCLFLYQLDDIMDNPMALAHMSPATKASWLPVIKNLHDEIIK